MSYRNFLILPLMEQKNGELRHNGSDMPEQDLHAVQLSAAQHNKVKKANSFHGS